MTDQLAAFRSISDVECSERTDAIELFYRQWANDTLVMNNWFSIQALSLPTTVNDVKQLMKHSSFDITNPNKLRSVIGTFCNGNLNRFHNKEGEGYRFLADQVIQLDRSNPQMAARLVIPLSRTKNFDSNRQALMKEQLTRIKNQENLSNDLFEIVSKSLV